MPRRPAKKPRTQTRATADAYRVLYLYMGPERSLAMLAKVGADAGLPKRSLNTLKRYSVDFGWVEAAREHDERMASSVTSATITESLLDEARQRRLGQRMQVVAEMSLERHEVNRGAELNGSQIARLAREGVNIERLASGMATSRVEILLGVVELLVERISGEFERAAAAMFAELGRHGVDLGEETRTDAWKAMVASFAPAMDALIDQLRLASGDEDMVVVDG